MVKRLMHDPPTNAREHGFLYGLATALLAVLTGWFASVVFRRD